MVQGSESQTSGPNQDICRLQTMTRKSAVFDMSDVTKDSQFVSLVSELRMTIEKMSLCPYAGAVVSQMNNVLADERNCAVSSLRCLKLFYGSDTQTFAIAVSYLDRFLSKVKVQNKYLSCLAAACYFLAAKINEEPENQPTAAELSSLHRQTWKTSDLLRMEFVILEKLDWHLWMVTCPVFIRIICDIISLFIPDLTLSLLDIALKKYEICINYNTSAVFRPSTLALCIIQTTLQEFEQQNPEVCHCLLWLHHICDMKDSELFECNSIISCLLNNYENKPKNHPACLPLPKPQPRISLVSRPSYYGDTDLPTIDEDAIEDYVTLQMEENTEVLDKFHIGKKERSWSYCLLPDRCLLPLENNFNCI